MRSNAGFTLIEMLIVVTIVMFIIGTSMLLVQSLDITRQIVDQNKNYQTVSQLYIALQPINEAVSIKIDKPNKQFFYQLPALDMNNKIIDPLQPGEWYTLKLTDGKLFKITPQNNTIQLSPIDIIIDSATFDFDINNRQIRVVLDVTNGKFKSRINIPIYMLNVINQI